MSVTLTYPLWPKQQKALQSSATELLYGGAAGPGKSHLARIAGVVWCHWIPGLQVYLFRREYRDLLLNHLDGPTGFRSLLQPLVDAKLCTISDKKIEFKNGSAINLCHCQYEKDVFGYQGSEMHVLILEEATQFTEFQIRYLRSRVRMPDLVRDKVPAHLKGQFPRILYATNPGGPGHAYLYRAIWEPAQHLPEYTLWPAPDSDGGFMRQFIPARLEDNPSIKPDEYRKALEGIGSEAYVRSLLWGDWTVVVGSMFSELAEPVHRILDLMVPSYWFKFAWYDWGYGGPAACVWFAMSDGERALTKDGGEITLPRGALIAYRELYIANPNDPSKGAQISNRDQAQMILEKTGTEDLIAYFADQKPFQPDGRSLGSSPATEFLQEGIRLIKAPTPRIQGWSLVHTRLRADPPMLYFCKSLTYAWQHMQMLQTDPKNPEDTTDGYLDELPDCIRGACTIKKYIADRKIPSDLRVQAAVTARPTINSILGSKAHGLFN